jgi:hypothetical protein
MKRKKSERGIALLMVLVVTAILSGLAADLQNETSVNLRASANARDELQAYFNARSAVELELFVLRFQGQMKEMLSKLIPLPFFQLSGAFVSSDTFKSVLVEEQERSSLTRGKDPFAGSFWIEEIVDENRKVNVSSDALGVGCSNYLHLLLSGIIGDPKYDRLFEGMGQSRDPVRNRLELIGNISDWVDGNTNIDNVCILSADTTVNNTPEDQRYLSLPYKARYKPKNGRMDSLEELRLVPGVNDAFMRLFGQQLTVWSDNKGISMKTADDQTIQSILRVLSPVPNATRDEDRIEKFFEQRALLMASPPPLNVLSQQTFETLLQSAQIPYNAERLNQLIQSQIIRFDDISNVYRIMAVGRVNEATSRITLVWRDNRAKGDLYYWKEE